ncbi:MAG: class I SAM-dependent methyltransferase [Euryarchaeota archaeon]
MSGDEITSFEEPSRLRAYGMMFELNIIGRPYYRRYVEGLGLRGDERVLEYGSGPGAASRYVAQRLVSGGGHLTCVDISSVWMTYLKRRMREYQNVDFKLGDIVTLDVQDESFDVVLIHFVLHEIELSLRQEKVNALARTLKSDGAMFVREPISEQHGMPPEEVRTLVSSTGLLEVRFSISKPRFWLNHSDCLFEKRPTEAYADKNEEERA